MAKTPLEPHDLRHTSEPLRGERIETTTHRGAVATEPERRRRGLGWLWALLAVLAAALLAALALGLFNGDDDGDQTAGQGQATTEQQATDNTQDATGTGAAAGGTAADGGGSLSVGGTSILPPPAGGLGDYVGQDATGENVVVQSVVRNAEENDTLEGFWVGSSEQDRTYVEWGGTVGSNEADYTPQVGEKLNLTGPVRPAPENPETALKLNAADAELVKSQGGFVNADEVSPAQD
jgi:hypothetical protein